MAKPSPSMKRPRTSTDQNCQSRRSERNNSSSAAFSGGRLGIGSVIPASPPAKPARGAFYFDGRPRIRGRQGQTPVRDKRDDEAAALKAGAEKRFLRRSSRRLRIFRRLFFHRAGRGLFQSRQAENKPAAFVDPALH